MAVKVPVMWNNMYLGGMSERQAELIMSTRNQDVIPNLKKMLFDFPPELVKKSLEICFSEYFLTLFLDLIKSSIMRPFFYPSAIIRVKSLPTENDSVGSYMNCILSNSGIFFCNQLKKSTVTAFLFAINLVCER